MKIRIPKGKECPNCPFFNWDEIYDQSFNFCNYYDKEVFRLDKKAPMGFYTKEKLPQCIKDFGKNGGEFELVKKEAKNEKTSL